jgi:DNA adenine methylase
MKNHSINILENTSDNIKDLFNEYSVGAKPFIKWVGGKTQLLRQFQKFYPNELKEGNIDEYIEPFLGGGAVFFDIVQKYTVNSAKLFDINEELILTYKVVQKDVEKLIDFLERYAKQYLKLDSKKRKEYFYEVRDNYNQQRFNIDYDKYSENWIPRAAQMIFLNKTCFNGLYRVNSKGNFNSPSGEYKNHNPKILDQNNLLNVSKVLKIADIIRSDFTTIIEYLKDNSFVYFDPPYRPISKTANFTSYSTFAFTDEKQIQLANVFKKLDNNGFKVMLSNSDPKNEDPLDNFFDDIYCGYNISRVSANRMVNSNAQKRGQINEIVITNY